VEVSVLCLREKAAQCRGLANGIMSQQDPAEEALLALAAEFEAKAEQTASSSGGIVIREPASEAGR
jgi:hypothetical protein